MEVEDRNNKNVDDSIQNVDDSIQNVDDSIQNAKTPHHSESEEESRRHAHEQIVPVLEEDYSISKQTNVKEAKIEKRVLTKTKTVKVPISYEELYINGKKLKSVEESQILSALKDKITSIASTNSGADTSVEQSVKKKNKIENRGEAVPLFSSENTNSNQSEIEKIITLYEEQFEIVKKVAKVAEIVITKRRVTEKKKIDIDLRGEQVKIKYPDGRSENLS
jgi:stress response protein YsnF